MQMVELGRLPKPDLKQKHDEFIVQKMKLDKFFSDFLDRYDLELEETNSENWVTYKQKLDEYVNLSQKIKWSQFYLGR